MGDNCMTEETPLKNLYNFLNEKVYSKMKKKDVKELKESCFGGEIEKQCKLYAKSINEKILNEKNEEIRKLNNHIQELIKRLRKYEPEDSRGYGERRYCGD